MGEKISFREKLSYAFGDMGCNFVWSTVSMFLTLYYTDSVGISAAVVGTIMLVTRLLDGVTDLVFGTILDRTHTKWGKARPWILWSMPMMAIGLILTFHVPSAFSETGKIVYASVTYIFVAAFAYTASNLSYNALLSLMTANQEERTSTSTIRFICTFATAIVLSSVTMPLVNTIGWSGTSILYAVLSAICFLITFSGSKERYQEEKKEEKKEQVSVIDGFRLLFKNKYFIPITLLFVAVYTASGLSGGIGIYYAREIIGNENAFGLINMANMIPIVIGLPLFPVLAKRFGKWKCMMAGTLMQIVGILLVLTQPESLTMLLIGQVIRGLGMAPNTAGLFALVADGVFYGEWKNGVRQDGLFNSVTSFGMKVGTGLGSAIVGWGLAIGNYNAQLAAQTEETLMAIKVLYLVLPLIIMAAGLVFLGFSNIDKIYPTMEKELAERAQKGQAGK